MPNFDVAIIGGGPAGLSAALALRARGCSVVVCSRPISRRPAETATPLLPSVLQAIGAEGALAACEPCYGIEARWGTEEVLGRPAIADPRGHAWFVHRGLFDDHLLAAARARGATTICGSASRVMVSASEVSMLVDNERIAAKWLVLATGSPSLLKDVTQQRPVMDDYLVAYWSLLDESAGERWLRVEATDYGWWYTSPAKESGVFSCLMTDAESARELGLRVSGQWALLRSATRFGPSTQPASLEVSSVAVSWLPRVHGDRWIATGDAAAKLDPISSAGTTSALEAGRRAADAIDALLRGERKPAADYERWYQRLVQSFVAGRRAHYRLEQSRRQSPFWARRPQVRDARLPRSDEMLEGLRT